MITAKEAFERTSVIYNNALEKEVNKWKKKLDKRIMRSVRHGKYEIDVYFKNRPIYDFRNSLMNYYRDLGFLIDVNQVYVSPYSRRYKLNISWRNITPFKKGDV